MLPKEVQQKQVVSGNLRDGSLRFSHEDGSEEALDVREYVSPPLRGEMYFVNE